MFTFTLTAQSVEELNTLIILAAQKVIDQRPDDKTLEDFSLQEIVERLAKHGYKVSHEDR